MTNDQPKTLGYPQACNLFEIIICLLEWEGLHLKVRIACRLARLRWIAKVRLSFRVLRCG